MRKALPIMQPLSSHALSMENLSPGIRSICKNDINSLLMIEEECFDHCRLGSRHFHYLMKHGNCNILVSESENQVTGYIICLYRKSSRNARIYSIAVSSKYRYLGHGAALLKEAMSVARKKRCEKIHLEMEVTNQRARHFYEKLGFHKIGIISDYYGKGIHATKLEKSLIT